MKTLKDIILEATSEVNPLPRRTKNFIDKHTVQKIDYPVDVENQFTAKNTKKDHTKGASYKNGEDSVVYEETDLEEKKLTDKGIKQALASAKAQAKSKDQVSLPKAPWDKVAEATMTDTDMKQRENIVKGMKKNAQSFKDRYGDRWKSVMYATATKAAMKEGLDPVGKEDSDVDNDGKHHTASDKYLKNRRKAIAAKIKEEVEQIDEISRDLARRYIRKVSDKNNTGEASPKEVMKRSPGVALAGKKVYGIGGKARVNATEEVDLDEAFKVGSMKLHDGSSVTLTRESAEALNGLFNQLNSSNKTKMEERLMSDSNGFQEILAFAKEL